MTGPNLSQTFKTSADWGQTWDAGSPATWSSQPTF
jgi:hypothetical protein